MSDPYDLQRFVDAQDRVYETVSAELTRRPQAKPLDVVHLSATARAGHAVRPAASTRSRLADEARAYLAHEVLGPRLRECARLVARSTAARPRTIFGWPDDLKVRSSMTLFARAADDNPDFVAVLDKFYGRRGGPGDAGAAVLTISSTAMISQPCGSISASRNDALAAAHSIPRRPAPVRDPESVSDSAHRRVVDIERDQQGVRHMRVS